MKKMQGKLVAKVFALLGFMSIIQTSQAQIGLIISELLVNPSGSDSPFEYLELRATKFINFATTPYSVVVANNGTATLAGWANGGSVTYGFNINTGTVNAGDVVYVGGSSMLPTGIKIRTINTGTVAGDGFGNAASGGVFGNGGANADAVAVFAADISTITNSTVPIDAVFYGTSLGTAVVNAGADGYQLPVNDLYPGGKLQSTHFIAVDPGASNLIATGVYDTVQNIFTTPRTWNTGALTDGTSSVTIAVPTTSAVLAFSSDNQTTTEASTTVTVNVTTNGSNSDTARVNVVVLPFGTASSTNDFSYTTQTLVFLPNSTVAIPVVITINNDALIESSEYFVLQLQNPSNANLTGITSHTIFIQDNENNAPIATNEINMSFVSSFSNGASGSNSAEIVAHDPVSQRIFVANSIATKLDIIDFSNPAAMSLINSIDISSYGNINSVAVKNGIVACAIENSTPELDGSVVFFNTNGVFLKQVTVGALPDMITFNHAGTKVITANEGQPNAAYTIDPEGSVSIINISGGIASLTQANVKTAKFAQFNSQIAALKTAGVRIFGPGATVAQDLEPEYVTVAENDLTAWVTLQENNAIAIVDLALDTIIQIKPLGFKDYSTGENKLDATNNGTNINIANWPIKGIYMPDALANFNVGGMEYIITANEGDARDYTAFKEETSIGNVNYPLDATAFPFASVMKVNANLGKLKCTNAMGDTDNDGDFDEVYTFGARSFSIWNATTGALVYDSGDDLEQITAADLAYGAMFNASNTNITKKDRSDDKGPEPEGVTVARIAGNQYAFISLERVGGMMMYNINNPAAPKFVQYVNNRGLAGLAGDRGPEGIIFIKQNDSPNGKGLIVLGNEVSSTISVYQIACPADSLTITGNTTICNGTSTQLNTDVISGATYTWYNGTSVISGATSSTYNATFSGSFYSQLSNVGCTIHSDTITIVVKPTSTFSQNIAICAGSSYLLPGGNYASVAGTYKDTLNAFNTCDSIITTNLTVNSLPPVPVITQNGAQLSSTVGSSYQWYFNGNPISGATAQTYTVSQNGNYSVVITNSFGCENLSAVINVTNTGVSSSNSELNVVGVYPNPFNEFSTIKINIAENSTVVVEVCNVLGEQIELFVNGKLSQGTYTYVFDAKQKGYSNGIYFVKVKINEQLSVTRLVQNK